jgi:hypothetical protein
MEEKEIDKLVEQTAQEFMTQTVEGKMIYSDFELLKEKCRNPCSCGISFRRRHTLRRYKPKK